MKRILLTSTALVAFAGAAAADVKLTGDAKLGYNDKDENGFYYSAGLFVKASKELDGGLTAGIDLDVDLKVKEGKTSFSQGGVTTSDYVLYLKSDVAAMYFGDTKTAAEQLVDGAFKSPVYGDYALANRFVRKTNVDGSKGSKDRGNVEGVLRGDYTMGDWKFSASALVYKDVSAGGKGHKLGAGQLAATGSFGDFNMGIAIQQEDGKVWQESKVGAANDKSVPGMVGVYVGGTFSNVDFALGHVRNTTAKTGSTVLKAAYKAGDFTVGGFYVNETVAKSDKYGLEGKYKSGPIMVMGQLMRDENAGSAFTQFKLDGSYDMGNGLVMKAGGLTQTGGKTNQQAYIAGEYNLGGSAKLLVSHAYDKAGGTDIGEPEYKEGTTMQVSFKF